MVNLVLSHSCRGAPTEGLLSRGKAPKFQYSETLKYPRVEYGLETSCKDFSHYGPCHLLHKQNHKCMDQVGGQKNWDSDQYRAFGHCPGTSPFCYCKVYCYCCKYINPPDLSPSSCLELQWQNMYLVPCYDGMCCEQGWETRTLYRHI